MNEIWNNLVSQFAEYMPSLLAALAVLVGGWILALLASVAVRKLLDRTSLDNRLASWIAGTDSKPVPIEKYAGTLTFWLVMLLVLIAFFQTLELTTVTEPLQRLIGEFVAYIPHLVAGGALILLAWVVAVVVRKVLMATFKHFKLDERLGATVSEEGQKVDSVSKPIADSVYWVVLLAFLPAVLGALRMDALLEPVNAMMNKFFGFLPNIIGAGVTLLVGWFVARIVQRLATSLLASFGVDRLAERWGFAKALGSRRFSAVLGLVLHFVILVPVLIAALDQLQMATVTQPASDMLNAVLVKLPQIIAAGLILLVAWFIGKVMATLIENLLSGLGFNQILVKMGISKKVPEGRGTPAAIAGMLLFIGIMLVATIAASETMNYVQIGDIVRQFLEFSGRVLLGVVLFGLGLMLANIVFNIITSGASPRAKVFAWLTRVAVIVLVGAMSLRATGVADSIVNLAFGALVCGLAAAAAIAFGLGGRRFASNQLARWQGDSGDKDTGS